MNDVVQFVAEQLASQRAQRGLSLAETAARAGIDPARLAGAEEAQTVLSEDELQQLADAFGVDVTAFFGGRVTPMQYLFGAG